MKKKVFSIAAIVFILLVGLAHALITPDGVTVTHYGERQYNDLGNQWRAYAWTTAVKDGQDQYHYTRARIVNAVITSIIYEDSSRIWGYSKTTATTGYVSAYEPLYAMRSYWGLEN